MNRLFLLEEASYVKFSFFFRKKVIEAILYFLETNTSVKLQVTNQKTKFVRFSWEGIIIYDEQIFENQYFGK